MVLHIMRHRNAARIGIVAMSLIVSGPIAAQDNLDPTLTDIVEARAVDSLSISPDGRRVAFRVISPSLAENRTTVQWYSAELSGDKSAIALGGKIEPSWLANFDVVEDGVSQWSPDSHSLFILEQARSQRQVHRLAPGGIDIAVTNDAADVVAFTVSTDGRNLDYQVRNARADIDAAQASEEREGVHLDRTVNTDGLRLTRNFRIGSRETTIRKMDASLAIEAFSGPLRTKTLVFRAPAPPSAPSKGGVPAASDWIDPQTEAAARQSLSLPRSGASIHLRELAPADPVLRLARYQVMATLKDGSTRACDADFCSGLSPALRQIFSNDDNDEIVIRYEKDFSGRSGLYGWKPLTGETRVIFPADGALDGGSGYNASPCQRSGPYLICVQAAATRPPRLVRIDLGTGAMIPLFDPNAALARKRFAKPRFISWNDAAGRPANGILVMPEAQSSPPPLVITTYRCRGFLKGGSGWMAPELILAQMGIAALCVNNNNATQLERGADGSVIPLVSHKASLASYQAAIDILARQGLIDRSRVGIAGHSYSSNVVAYAISHSDMFAAAVGVGVTIDPSAYFIAAPTSDSFRKYVPTAMGLPYPNRDPDHLWQEISPALNAKRIKAPLLMQPPESEYLFALQLYTYIQDAGGTVDMYIYPHEGHLANRLPSHIYWRNRRSLDWFAFWLQGKENRSAETAQQFDHWEALRAARESPDDHR